jgi:glycyl-tRNA synthetase
MVVELTSLAGTMAREYARAAGEPEAVAQALFDAELPRGAGGDLPHTKPGALLALADRLDALVGLAATVGLPTGSSDPFALRRAALGALAILRGSSFMDGVHLDDALAEAAQGQPVPVDTGTRDALAQFLTRRLEQQLVDEGQPVDRVRAVLVHAMTPRLVDRLLGQLATLVARPRFIELAAALQRVRRIVPPGTPAGGDPALLVEPAERRLRETVSTVGAELDGRVDLVRFTKTASALAQPIAQFFDDVLVMSDDPALRAARLGLLATIRDLAQAQLDWSELRL